VHRQAELGELSEAGVPESVRSAEADGVSFGVDDLDQFAESQ
jgi:hypothetical protein